MDEDKPKSEPQVGEVVASTHEKSKNSVSIRDTSATSLMNPEVYVQMKILAQDFINSKAVPSCWQSSAQVLVGLQTGLEMGMTPMESMNSLYVVNGAVNIWGKAVTRRLRIHGYRIEYPTETETEVTATITRGDESHSFTFKYQDAVDSGYTTDNNGKEKFGWKKGMNRKLKLRYGALGALLKTEVPEVLGSLNGVAEIENDFSDAPKQLPSTVDQEEIDRIAKAVKNDTDQPQD